MRKPIYSDMDNVLEAPVEHPVTGNPIDAHIRPGVEEFLARLTSYGDVYLLTAASRSWAAFVLRKMGPMTRFFKGIISKEDLYPIALQMEIVDKSPGLSDRDREELQRQIQPLFPPGVVFDDYPVGSDMYRLKGLATGIVYRNPSLWIQVDEYVSEDPEDRGLEKAYQEFKRRNTAWRGSPAMGRKTRSA